MSDKKLPGKPKLPKATT